MCHNVCTVSAVDGHLYGFHSGHLGIKNITVIHTLEQVSWGSLTHILYGVELLDNRNANIQI